MKSQDYWDKIFLFLEGRDFKTIDEIFLDRVLLSKIVKTKKNKPIILDIGCGTGDLLAKLSSRGYVADGIDISQVAINKAHTLLGNSFRGKLIYSNIDKDGLASVTKKYDIIFMKLVIAFIGNKEMVLKEVSDRLNRGGYFVLITPTLEDGVSYTLPKTRNISVNKKEIEILLSKYFSSWEILNMNFEGDNMVVATYLAKKR